MRRVRMKGQRGFSLIELGIVVAVIAILATVVLVGRGFLESSRVSKMVEVIDTVAKGTAVYAGTNGGVIPGNVGDDYLQDLVDRNLVPTAIATSVPNFTITAVEIAAGGNPGEQFDVDITCSSNQAQQACEDICNAKARDHSLIGTNGCGGGANITLTFRI